jgi:hypothetical protein
MKFVLSSLTLIPTFAVLAEVSYNQDVRPILAENCFYCHGQDPNKRKADLRLDVREAAVEFGAFVPGKPEESELVARLFSHEPDELMPPAKSNRKLTDKQKSLLKQWIAEEQRFNILFDRVDTTATTCCLHEALPSQSTRSSANDRIVA